jgi:pyruvate/2-oxoglutarate dehydrogenase complex dihydrolipoamide acyltransferase (E2) component
VRFGDASGRSQIVALLEPAKITAPMAGKIVDNGAVGTAVRQGGLVAKVQTDGQVTEVRSPITGRIRSISARAGQDVAAGAEIATIDPDTEQVWEALRALYLVGQPEDLPAILPYKRDLASIPDRVREQAVLAEQAIRERASQQH